MSRCKNWCFTSFNIDINWEHLDIQTIDKKNAIKYIVYQGEYTKENKKHIQGYVQFHDKKEMTYVKKLIGDKTLHLEQAKGTPEQNREYCMKTQKDDIAQDVFFTPKEYGTIDLITSGYRTDIQRIKEKIDNGETIRHIQRNAENNEFELTLKYNRLLTEYADDIQQEKEKDIIKNTFKDYVFNPVQTAIKNIVEREIDTTNTRQVNWIYDPVGGTGKTQLARYLITHYDTLYITGGKVADIHSIYNGEQIVIFDLARTYAENVEHIYSVIETLKNGLFLSTKYQVKSKVFSKQPIILVLANFKPDTTKLSQDRWNILYTEYIDNDT